MSVIVLASRATEAPASTAMILVYAIELGGAVHAACEAAKDDSKKLRVGDAIVGVDGFKVSCPLTTTHRLRHPTEQTMVLVARHPDVYEVRARPPLNISVDVFRVAKKPVVARVSDWSAVTWPSNFRFRAHDMFAEVDGIGGDPDQKLGILRKNDGMERVIKVLRFAGEGGGSPGPE